MRFASPNERRLIFREGLGVYSALVVGAIYEFENGRIDIRSKKSFVGPLRHCIDKHPALSIIIKKSDTEKPLFERVSVINLENHIAIDDHHGAGLDETATIEEILPSMLDRPWVSNIPAWRIVVIPLNAAEPTGLARCFIAFSYSHILGDGISGPAFHHTFLDGLLRPTDPEDSWQIAVPNETLPEPFDTKERLPISWAFLLAPLTALLLPKFITDLLGLRMVPNAADAGTWTGPPIFEPSVFRSKLKLFEIENSKLSRAVRASRTNDAKLTATIHQLITRALSRAVPNQSITNFVSQTAINLRGSIGVSNDQMGNIVSGYYGKHPRVDASGPISDEFWAAANLMSKELAESTATLQDQPVGLLRFLPSIRKWMTGKIGQDRDSSYEVSNLGAIATPGGDTRITKMVFAQPANITVLLAFNIVSVQGGSLVGTVTWQPGTLSVPEEDEGAFLAAICTSLKADFERLE